MNETPTPARLTTAMATCFALGLLTGAIGLAEARHTRFGGATVVFVALAFAFLGVVLSVVFSIVGQRRETTAAERTGRMALSVVVAVAAYRAAASGGLPRAAIFVLLAGYFVASGARIARQRARG